MSFPIRVFRLSFFLSTLIAVALVAIGAPHRADAASPEFRGAWVASVYNIDWPSKTGLSPAAQKAELIQLLNKAQELNLNAILLQVRPESDALYSSSKEPWSRFLTGTQGKSPGYDPLAFAIKEAHARGLELHAWFNPFRASANAKNQLDPSHIAKRKPEWVRRFNNQLWIDPGIPEAREYVISVMVDVASRYPVDGIHIDDYFYPYPKSGLKFPDDSTAARYAGSMSRGDWRRNNINRFVEAMYRRVKAARPSARIGISPFGIWRPGVPATIEGGLDSYAHLFADSRKWLAEGWCDYLAPQLYWSISPSKQSFPVLLDWWRAQSSGAPIWPGIASDRIGKERPAQEMINQISLTRKGAQGAPGHIHWSMKSLLKNQGGIATKLKNGPYADKAAKPVR